MPLQFAGAITGAINGRRAQAEFFAERAALVLNRLHQIHSYAAQVLCMTLTSFVETYNETLTLFDRIRNTNRLEREVMLLAAPARIFISYAREDGQQAERLRADLEKKGFGVWKDTHELLLGEQWEHKIKKAQEEHDFLVLCLSRVAVAKTGFFQVEVKEAIKWQQYRPDSKVYIIPIRVKCRSKSRSYTTLTFFQTGKKV